MSKVTNQVTTNVRERVTTNVRNRDRDREACQNINKTGLSLYGMGKYLPHFSIQLGIHVCLC